MWRQLKYWGTDAVMDDEPILNILISQGQNWKPNQELQICETAFAVKRSKSRIDWKHLQPNVPAKPKANGEFQKILDKYLASESSFVATSTVDETTIWGLLQTTTNNSLAAILLLSSSYLICYCHCYRDHLYV